MSKVSIIIPVYNVEKYLRECLDSVIGQSLQDIEILCGDGGSNDGSLEILYEYAKKDSRIKVISKQGSGYGQSVNDCMNIATGEYIGIVESDDVIKENMYETLYKVAHENDLDWVRADIYYYYSGLEKEKQLVRESIIYEGTFYNEVLNPQEDYRPYKSGLRTWSGIYKTAFLNEYHIRHNETPGGAFQDVGFYLKTLYYATRVYFVKEPFYMWRQDNPGSSIHYNSKKLVDNSLREWHLNQDYLDEHPGIGSRAVASYHYRKFFSYLWTIEMAQGEDKKYVEQVAYQEFKNALENGELDKGFFETWEWDRLRDSMEQWRTESNSVVRPTSKFSMRKMLHPLASIAKKIMYKLMQNVILHFDYDFSEIKKNQETLIKQLLNQEESLKKISIIQNKCVNYESILSNHETLINQFSLLADETNQTLQTQNQRLLLLEDYSPNILACLKNMDQTTALTNQKILNQEDLLSKISTCTKDINQTTDVIQQKVLDHGDLLWRISTRTEDINQTTEITQQKTLDQGDLLWRTNSRIQDIFQHQQQNADTLMWTLQYELGRKNLAQTIENSPMYDMTFYLNNRYGSVISAQHILPTIFEQYNHESIIDFGCGTGTWLWVAQLLGAKKVLGLDGKYVPDNLLMIPKDNFIACDLQEQIEIPETYDIAISMEVAEHLQPDAADTFIQNITQCANRIIFSAAHPGQGGDGHINEQPKEYWIEKFKANEFDYVDISKWFAEDTKIQFWYRDNIMMFERENP